MTGLPRELSEETMGACYGDALFAARAAGLVDVQEDWAHKAADVTPDESHRAIYDRLYEIYRQLYPATRDQVHALAKLQAEQGLVPADGDVDEAL